MMTKKERNQARRDVERLRKAAERIENGQDALDDALERLDIAIQGLQIIATWAKSSKQEDIHIRAMDTLALIDKEEKKEKLVNKKFTPGDDVGLSWMESFT